MEAVQRTPTQDAVVFPSEEMTSEQYHSEPDHISSSQLVEVLRTPAHYFLAKNGAFEDEESDLMRLGTAAHTVLLEPDEFKNRYFIAPRNYSGRLKADKLEQTTLELEHPGKKLLEPKEFAVLEKLVRGMRSHARARELLCSPGQCELSIFWRDPLTGLNLKVRLDRFVHLGANGTMLEVKTTDDASAHAFTRKIIDMDYDLRAAMYVDGCQKAFGFTPEIEWLVIERETGFMATYKPSPRMLARGRDRYEKARIAIAHCEAFNSWPAYQTGLSTEVLELPRWVKT